MGSEQDNWLENFLTVKTGHDADWVLPILVNLYAEGKLQACELEDLVDSLLYGV